MRKIGIRRGLVLASSGLLAAGVLVGNATPGLAAPAATVQVTSHSLAADVSDAAVITGKVVPAGPDIEQVGCDDLTSFHIYMVSVTECFGQKGTFNFSANDTHSVCSGTNKGHLVYYNPEADREETWTFTPGSAIAWPYVVSVDSLTITGWSGSSKCPE